ncbi:mannose-6-phosphate isomerase, class I [Serinicoccus sediminis]|uniref:mannose-6-phosphate isomerase, class I n=1 Tax=Serinicoccus sediminis TaxID=2306021 RepID=UPI001020ADDA|nr:mannose-6-phosphate isomerase, class I [Serinicoccus sediminis]
MSGTVRIDGVVRDYAWGRPGGISTARGRAPGAGPEAELWLGAHPAAPSPVVPAGAPWPDLGAWQTRTGAELPFLMKLIAAGAPLSLQAHPDDAQARAGYEREEAAGIPRDAPDRSYRDPHAKPEVLLAVEDGFDALCGFRPVRETLALLDRLADRSPGPAVDRWRSLLAEAPDEAAGTRAALGWLLSGADAVTGLVGQMTSAALDEEDGALARTLHTHHPGDPGIAVALMLNRVRLAAGQALWLAPGTIHAYLGGLGVEVMGPSDNVLRGGLSGKHVDTPELLRILDTTPGAPPLLTPVDLAPGARAYRPGTRPGGAGVRWQLLELTGPAAVAAGSPTVALVLDGEFTLRQSDPHAQDAAPPQDAPAPDAELRLARGEAGFVDRPGRITVEGTGRLYLATTVA